MFSLTFPLTLGWITTTKGDPLVKSYCLPFEVRAGERSREADGLVHFGWHADTLQIEIAIQPMWERSANLPGFLKLKLEWWNKHLDNFTYVYL